VAPPGAGFECKVRLRFKKFYYYRREPCCLKTRRHHEFAEKRFLGNSFKMFEYHLYTIVFFQLKYAGKPLGCSVPGR
jgi:hypothetical protein